MDWWNVTIFGLIPVLSVAMIFCFKRRFLWAAPLISTVLAIIVSIAAMPSILKDNEHRAMFFGIGLPIHLAVVISLTGISYIIALAIKRKKQNH